MSVVDILEPVLTGGIRNTNFFNGRLLTAEDLTDFQKANAQQHQQLGQALGEGVAYGFEVDVVASADVQRPILHITQGLALNRKGQAVALPADVDLALVPQASATRAEAGLFAECHPTTTTILTNPGLYILTAVPASDFSKESAPKTEVGTEGPATTCGSRWAVEGAKFNVVRFDLGTFPSPSSLAGQAAQLATELDPLLKKVAAGSATADELEKKAKLLSKLRNCVAHLCFGTEELAGCPSDPFGRKNGQSLFAEYGVVDQLRDLTVPALTDCDVPLAVLYWTSTGLQYVDMWSVRRPIFPQPVSGAWAQLAGKRRLAEGLAMFLQFQCQLSGLMKKLSSSALDAVKASDYFRYLPPVGLLPISGIGSSAGMNYPTFFSGKAYREPQFVEGATLMPLFGEGLSYPPVDVTDKVMVWLYRSRENVQAIYAASGNVRNAYLIFTSGQMRNWGHPHYDVNRWDYSTYA